MNAKERHERMSVCVEALKLENFHTPVLVEGLRDEQALRRLGLEGEIIIYNSGQTLGATADALARTHKRLILLLDWDRTGGHLVKRFLEHVHAQLELDLTYRKEFSIVSQVKSVEDLPAAVRLIEDRAGSDPTDDFGIA
ncbi:MAG TPA: topoisomerase [Candidatus Thermoplasmatota archaeon]